MARTRANDWGTKRDAILRASARVIAERGVDRASMARIAEACGVSKALLYHYYPSKEALVFDIVAAHLAALEAALARADDARLEPEARLRRLVRATLDAYRDSDDRHKVQLAAMALLPDDKAEAIRAAERAIVRRFSGVLRLVNPALAEGPLLAPVTMSLFGMMNWAYMWFRPDGPITREAYADLAAQLILEGARSIRPESRPEPRVETAVPARRASGR